MLTRMHIAVPAIAALLICSGVGRAGYVSRSFGGDVGVTFEAYDGKGAAGGGLNAGEVRLTFTDNRPTGGGDSPDTFVNAGLQSVGFNTDLSLTAGQIKGPAGWNVIKNAKFGPTGQFSWAVGTVTNFQDPAVVLITGLGADATFAHFNLGSTGGSSPNLFGGRFISIVFSPDGVDVSSSWATSVSPVTETPEPASLAIAGFAAAGLAFARWRRRG